MASFRKLTIGLGIAGALAVGCGYVVSRRMTWLLKHQPHAEIERARRLFGHVLNPIVLWMADRFGMDVPTVYHIGRRSGTEYAAPLCVTETSEGYIVPAAFGPGVDWLANLAANPHARLRHGHETFPVEAEVIDREAALRIAGESHCPCWDQFEVKDYAILRRVESSPDDRPAPERRAESA